jgi:hypothetical protein
MMPYSAPSRACFKGKLSAYRQAGPLRLTGSVPQSLTPSPSLRHRDANHGGSQAKGDTQMIIRAKNFRSWFNATLRGSARDLASYGADAGFPCITYTSDTVKIFDRFGDEIWNMAVEQADELGCKNVADMIGGFRRSDMLDDLATFKTLMVWFACETLASENTE